MHPVVVKSCGHRMWLRVVSICDVTLDAPPPPVPTRKFKHAHSNCIVPMYQMHACSQESFSSPDHDKKKSDPENYSRVKIQPNNKEDLGTCLQRPLAQKGGFRMPYTDRMRT